jgi:hypothetical protein
LLRDDLFAAEKEDANELFFPLLYQLEFRVGEANAARADSGWQGTNIPDKKLMPELGKARFSKR